MWLRSEEFEAVKGLMSEKRLLFLDLDYVIISTVCGFHAFIGNDLHSIAQ